MATGIIHKIKQADISDIPTSISNSGVGLDMSSISRKGIRYYAMTSGQYLPIQNQTTVVIECIFDNNAGVQIACPIATSKMYVRYLAGGSWSSWIELA